MTPLLLCWLVMTSLVGVLLFSHYTDRLRLQWFAKPAAALTFIITGLIAGGLGSTFGRVLVLGLVLAAVGDVLLIPKNKAAFRAGLLSFLAGHLAYTVAFGLRGVDAKTALGTLAALALPTLLVLRWLRPHVETKMRLPVLTYVGVITLMVALAAGTAVQTRAWFVLLGAVLFYLSDLSVARDRFVKNAFVNRLWGLPLYFLAQMLLASQAGS